MLNNNAKLAQLLAVAAVLPPAATANTERFSGVVDMSQFLQAQAVVSLGDMANETVTIKVYACDASGNSAEALTGKTVELAASASANDSKQVVINVRAEDLLDTDLHHIKVGVVTGSSDGGPAGAVVLGAPRQGWGTALNAASVVQVVL